MHDLCFHGTQLFGHIDWVSVLGRLFHDQRDAERAEREVGMSVIHIWKDPAVNNWWTESRRDKQQKAELGVVYERYRCDYLTLTSSSL